MDKPTQEDIKKIKSWVRKCMNLLKKKEYPLNITRSHVEKAVKVTRVVNKKVTGATYAGYHVIQINFGYWQFLRGHWRDGYMKEYDAYKKNKVYGSRTVTDMDDRLLVVVAHEVAHHVQRGAMRSKGIYKKSHGDGFQRIYRWLRQDLVNPIIDAKIAEQDKLIQLKKITRRRQMDLPMDGEEFKLVA
tara:strand:- start:3755 stop:4318 length:564 start_codon:yes stop_codon:yes gene_type:complete